MRVDADASVYVGVILGDADGGPRRLKGASSGDYSPDADVPGALDDFRELVSVVFEVGVAV